MAMKWHRVASFGRRKVFSATRTADGCADSGACSSPVADRDHFVVYTSEGMRFMVPLEYLSSSIFNQLLQMSEEEYGLARDGPIMLPCDSSFMEYVLSLLRKQVPKDVEMALLSSLLEHQSSNCSLFPVGHSQQIAVCSF